MKKILGLLSILVLFSFSVSVEATTRNNELDEKRNIAINKVLNNSYAIIDEDDSLTKKEKKELKRMYRIREEQIYDSIMSDEESNITLYSTDPGGGGGGIPSYQLGIDSNLGSYANTGDLENDPDGNSTASYSLLNRTVNVISEDNLLGLSQSWAYAGNIFTVDGTGSQSAQISTTITLDGAVHANEFHAAFYDVEYRIYDVTAGTLVSEQVVGSIDAPKGDQENYDSWDHEAVPTWEWVILEGGHTYKVVILAIGTVNNHGQINILEPDSHITWADIWLIY